MCKIVIHKRKYSMRLTYSTIIWFFLLVWTFEPQYFREGYTPILHQIFMAGRLIAAGILCVIVFIRWYFGKNYKPSLFMLFICFEECVLLIASILNNNANSIIRVMADNVYLTLPFCAGLDYALQKRTASVLHAMLLISEILIYGNLLSVIMNPNGLYNIVAGSTRKYYLLGQQNLAIMYILIGLAVSLLYSHDVVGKRISLRVIALVAASVYMELIFQSATGLVGLFVFTTIFFLSEFKKVHIDLKWGIIASIAIYLIFIVFQSQEIFSGFITNVLNRDITASTRTTVWARALISISERPIIGYGVEDSELAILRFGYITPHNRFLYLLYRGGVVLLTGYVFMILKASQSLMKEKTQRTSVYISSTLFALLLQMQFESYDSVLFYILFIIAFQVERIVLLSKDNS